MKKKNKYTYIDLFCGAGGFSVGFDKAGFQNLFSLDNDESFCKTYEVNFPNHDLIKEDIENLSNKRILELIGNTKPDVVVGGPPCQGFSIAGNIGRKFLDDPRNHLFNEFVRVVSVTKPRYFVMENVARLYTHNNGETRKVIISKFSELGYRVEARVLNTADFGVPQVRRRVVFIGTNTSNDGELFPEITTDKYKTVKEAISDLPALLSGETHPKVPNHSAMKHTQQMLSKMKFVKDGLGRECIPLAQRPKTGDVRKYIRYNSKKPSVTVTGDMRKIFHYSQNRALTVRELARLQSFEDSFVFASNSISQQQQVGNAVPPLLAGAIANKIKTSLSKYDE